MWKSRFSGAKGDDYWLFHPNHIVKQPGMAIDGPFLGLFDPHCMFFHFGHNVAKLLIYQATRTSGCRSKTVVSGTNLDFTNASGQETALDMNIV